MSFSGDQLIFREDTALPYRIFKLTKTGWETQALMSNISKKHGMPVDAWGFQDSRIGVQRRLNSFFTSRYSPKHRISGKDWTLEPHGTLDRHLKSGDRSGNRFSIVVRDIRHRRHSCRPSRADFKIGLPIGSTRRIRLGSYRKIAR